MFSGPSLCLMSLSWVVQGWWSSVLWHQGMLSSFISPGIPWLRVKVPLCTEGGAGAMNCLVVPQSSPLGRFGVTHWPFPCLSDPCPCVWEFTITTRSAPLPWITGRHFLLPKLPRNPFLSCCSPRVQLCSRLLPCFKRIAEFCLSHLCVGTNIPA